MEVSKWKKRNKNIIKLIWQFFEKSHLKNNLMVLEYWQLGPKEKEKLEFNLKKNKKKTITKNLTYRFLKITQLEFKKKK
jgi:hypothetical protein